MESAQLQEIQSKIRQYGLEGWLLCIFRDQNPIARRVLRIPSERVRTRRCYYFIPASGSPVKLLHRIEPEALSHLPGKDMFYLSYQELSEGLHSMLKSFTKVALEYTPMNAVPYVSLVDGGTIELIQDTGVEVVSSADLVQEFEAVLSAEQCALQDAAADALHQIMLSAFDFIRENGVDGELNEYAVQQHILALMEENDLQTDHPPIVGFGSNSGNPHYDPCEEGSAHLSDESVILIDMWARKRHPEAVYADITWMGYYGSAPPLRFSEVFTIVANARTAGLELVRKRFAAGIPVQGWEVDREVRDVIDQAGYGAAFIHRTGHNIGIEDHGNGAHIDNLETKEVRRLIPGTSFSLEPGIYLPEFGVRLEYDVRIEPDNSVIIVGGEEQSELLII